MGLRISILLLAIFICASQSVSAKECWALSNLKGHLAASVKDYKFEEDKFSKPMVLCFEEETGTVSDDDTSFTRFGTSTLIGWVQNKGIELVEVFQIDRTKKRVLFTKTRIGTGTVLPNGPDVIAAFVGDATLLPIQE